MKAPKKTKKTNADLGEFVSARFDRFARSIVRGRKKRARKVNNGRGATPAEVAKMRGLGYAPPGVAAARFKVNHQKLRRWLKAEGWLLDAEMTMGNVRPRAFREGGRIWVLLSAVAEKVKLPAGVAP